MPIWRVHFVFHTPVSVLIMFSDCMIIAPVHLMTGMPIRLVALRIGLLVDLERPVLARAQISVFSCENSCWNRRWSLSDPYTFNTTLWTIFKIKTAS
jgi:hypothetical protein